MAPTNPRYAFVWPKDGKRTTKRGRFIDILTNRGPDIHIATHRGHDGKKNLGWDYPTRAQWSRWEFVGEDGPSNIVGPPVWARHAGDVKYDFRTRRWKRYAPELWSDVRWETGARARESRPVWFRDAEGIWWYTHEYYLPAPPRS